MKIFCALHGEIMGDKAEEIKDNFLSNNPVEGQKYKNQLVFCGYDENGNALFCPAYM